MSNLPKHGIEHLNISIVPNPSLPQPLSINGLIDDMHAEMTRRVNEGFKTHPIAVAFEAKMKSDPSSPGRPGVSSGGSTRPRRDYREEANRPQYSDFIWAPK